MTAHALSVKTIGRYSDSVQERQTIWTTIEKEDDNVRKRQTIWAVIKRDNVQIFHIFRILTCECGKGRGLEVDQVKDKLWYLNSLAYYILKII